MHVKSVLTGPGTRGNTPGFQPIGSHMIEMRWKMGGHEHEKRHQEKLALARIICGDEQTRSYKRAGRQRLSNFFRRMRTFRSLAQFKRRAFLFQGKVWNRRG